MCLTKYNFYIKALHMTGSIAILSSTYVHFIKEFMILNLNFHVATYEYKTKLKLNKLYSYTLCKIASQKKFSLKLWYSLIRVAIKEK